MTLKVTGPGAQSANRALTNIRKGSLWDNFRVTKSSQSNARSSSISSALFSDYLQKRVRLKRRGMTVAGHVFQAGTVGRVTSHHRGRLAISFIGGGYIRAVSINDVELLFGA